MSKQFAFILCAALTMVFGACSYFAALQKSPTIDEPICALSGYIYVADGDLRFDVDNPPLWKYWAVIPNLGRELKPAPAEDNAFLAATRRLFQTPGNDGEAFVNRSRAMMMLLGMMLAAAIAVWGWQVGGAAAALTACTLFCFDPNFLAHAPLIKADVTIALLMFCITWATWSVGKRAGGVNISVLSLLCGAAVTVKYNGIMACFIPAFLLLGRAIMREPWIVLNRAIQSRVQRTAAALAILLVAGVTTYIVIWAGYQFRYEPSRISGVNLDIPQQVRQLKEAQFILQHGMPPTAEQIEAAPTPLVAGVAMFLDKHRLLPQAWLYGLVSIYRSSTTLARQSYLMGQTSMTGWWYYFPLAMLFKTPLATLVAISLAGVVLFSTRKRTTDRRLDHWTTICLTVPTVIYALASMTSSTNAGIRFVLPLYPPLYLCVGIAAAKLKHVRPRIFLAAAVLLGIGLAIESLGAFPHYISYFNAASRGQRLFLLSDSNFDWGQDLKYVAKWQKEHPETKLYLGYWGPVDPHYYGISYTNLPGGFGVGRDNDQPFDMSAPGVVMISATLLQGVNFPPAMRDYYATLRARPPREIIGDTIYLYDWPP